MWNSRTPGSAGAQPPTEDLWKTSARRKRGPRRLRNRTPLLPRAILAFARKHSRANAGIAREKREVGRCPEPRSGRRTRVRAMEPVRVRGLPQPGRTVVMGVVNVTPDSFSDGGQWFAADKAIRHGVQLWDEGADLVEVGGESTRPGAERPEPAEELRRVLPVIEGLAVQGAAVSVDTMRAQTARAGRRSGRDPGQRRLRRASRRRDDHDGGGARRSVCVHALARALDRHAESGRLRRRGVGGCRRARRADRALPDGWGRGRSVDHRPRDRVRQDRRAQLGAAPAARRAERSGLPLLVGVSRKTFLGHLLGTEERPRPARERDDASVAFTALLVAKSVWGVRTHTVRAHRDAVAVAQRLIDHSWPRDQPLTVGRRAFGGRIGSGVRR